MTRTVVKYIIQPGIASGRVHVQVPQGSSVLGLGVDAQQRPVVYVLVDMDRPTVWRTLHVAETNEVLPDEVAPAMYVGSVLYGLHVFDLGERR